MAVSPNLENPLAKGTIAATPPNKAPPAIDAPVISSSIPEEYSSMNVEPALKPAPIAIAVGTAETAPKPIVAKSTGLPKDLPKPLKRESTAPALASALW